ncbi:hypothetical protein V2J09_005716 [Rumex salicifolius]
MEFNLIWIALTIACVWVLTWGWRALNWVYLRPRKLERLLRQQGLRGNSYKLLFGDMIDSIRMKNEARSKPMEYSNDILSYVDPHFNDSLKNHGENAFIWFGPVPVVTVTQPELIKEVFSKVKNFPKPHFSLVELLMPGIATINGQEWAKHRKLINPAFHMEKLKLLMPAFDISCNEMMNNWEKMVSITGWVELDVWPHLVNMTSGVISRATFSSNYIEGRQAFELLEEQAQIVFNSIKQCVIPGWRYVPTKANRRFNKVQKEIRNLVKGIIEKRMIEMEEAEEMKRGDFLGTMMENNLNEMQKHGSYDAKLGITIDQVIDECKTLYFAGHESTSILLAYTMISLSKYTDWQTKAREEVLNAFGKSTPDFDGLNKLKTVTMILYEVLRLYPPIPSTWRKVDGDTKLGKWSLPDGVYLNLPIISSHHDRRHWGEDVAEFNPERFSQGISKATKENYVFAPFAMGPRVCVGQNLAMIEAKMALAMILQRFSFQLSPSYDHSPFWVLTMRPQFGAQVILHHLSK